MPSSGVRPAAPAPARLSAVAPYVARRRAAFSRAPHGGRDGPVRVRDVLSPGRRARPPGTLEAGDGARSGRGDDGAGVRFLRPRRPRSRRPRRLSACTGPSAARGAARRTRHRSHRRGLGARRSGVGAPLLALVVSLTARAAAGTADRWRPERILRPPRLRAARPGQGVRPLSLRLYPSVLDVWRDWADDLSGTAIDATHFLAEDQSWETAERLQEFTSAR